jgi:hypothetical protein
VSDVRIDRVDIEVEALTALQAELLAAAIPGAFSAQLLLDAASQSAPRKPSKPPAIEDTWGDKPDIDAIAAEVAAQVLETIRIQRERTDEEAAWR